MFQFAKIFFNKINYFPNRLTFILSSNFFSVESNSLEGFSSVLLFICKVGVLSIQVFYWI